MEHAARSHNSLQKRSIHLHSTSLQPFLCKCEETNRRHTDTQPAVLQASLPLLTNQSQLLNSLSLSLSLSCRCMWRLSIVKRWHFLGHHIKSRSPWLSDVKSSDLISISRRRFNSYGIWKPAKEMRENRFFH